MVWGLGLGGGGTYNPSCDLDPKTSGILPNPSHRKLKLWHPQTGGPLNPKPFTAAGASKKYLNPNKRVLKPLEPKLLRVYQEAQNAGMKVGGLKDFNCEPHYAGACFPYATFPCLNSCALSPQSLRDRISRNSFTKTPLIPSRKSHR